MKRTNVLVVGSGGREHALGWKLAGSPLVNKVYFAPGNGGTSENLPIGQAEIEKLADAASRIEATTIVGPEEPLSLGIADLFSARRLPIFGPTKGAAMLETSKAFAKEFMLRHGIPTAEGQAFEDPGKALDYVKGCEWKLVVKADGLAAGKGVIVCDDSKTAMEAIDRIMVRKEFGAAGDRIVIEKRIFGDEASFISICDGRSVIPLASAQDHKRVLDGDRGPNTGGMGAFSPTPTISVDLAQRVLAKIVKPAVSGMNSRGTPFVGFLYAGLMIERETQMPYVLEFNARMGDPECQPIMMRMKSDLYPYIEAAIDKKLDSLPDIQWSDETAICIVMAAKGYPGHYEKGRRIAGLDENFGEETMVFHAGTSRSTSGEVVTNGGRVLGVTSRDRDAKHAMEKAYSAASRIKWGDNEQYYRKDIGQSSLR